MTLKPGKKMSLGIRQTDMLVTMMDRTCDEELNCEEVFENLETYAEYALISGDKVKTRIIRLVEDHLKLCRDCAEEYQLLLKALKSVDV